LTIYEASGPEGTAALVVKALGNLATFYESQGRAADAVPLRKRIDAIKLSTKSP
jgi:hypothetical protein